VKPVPVFCVPLYHWGPLAGFNETLSLDDEVYEERIRAQGRNVLLAPSEDGLRERIRKELRMDPDANYVIWLNDQQSVDRAPTRVFDVLRVTSRQIADDGTILSERTLDSSQWRYLTEDETMKQRELRQLVAQNQLP
jgi:hypothetical protein